MNDPLPISVYLMEEWWDTWFHHARACPRPPSPSQVALVPISKSKWRSGLEDCFLKRKRFLFEQLGEFGLGEESPVLNGQIATVIRYGFDLVPALLGTRLDFLEAWGFYPRFRTLEEIRGLRPVDIAQHPEGEWLAREAQRLKVCYGECSHCLDIGSVTNNAFRILGEALYAEMMTNPSAVQSLFETVLQTMECLYVFIEGLFGQMHPVPVSNCNVSLMGPARYEALVLPFDALQTRFAERRHGCAPRAALHHCDVPADPFLPAYAKLPGVASLQAAITTDIEAAQCALPGARFSVLVSPGLVSGNLDHLRVLLQRAVSAGVTDLALWNIDPTTSVEQLRDVLSSIRVLCEEHHRVPAFSALPLCWEELEWAHSQYQ